MIDLHKLILFVSPRLGLAVGAIDPILWNGADASPAAMQAALDVCVVSWGTEPPIDGAAVFAAIPDFLNAQTIMETQERAAKIAAKRYEAEVGGLFVNGIAIPSDRDTQMKMMAARIRAKEDPAYSVQWKAPGGFVLLDASGVIAIADALADHVQACFDREAQLLADPTLDINTGWPGQAA